MSEAPDPLAPKLQLAAQPLPPPPVYLSSRISELGQGFDGRVGIAVKSIDDGWSTGWMRIGGTNPTGCSTKAPRRPRSSWGRSVTDAQWGHERLKGNMP